MKYIQSFWLTSNLTSGWQSVRYHLMGWALSAYSIHKHQGKVHLYTNSEGAEVLLQKLQLPYSSHELIFDDYQTEFEAYGFLKKLRAYSQPQSPFLHIDGDAFLFEPLPAALLTAPLVAQNYEYNHPCYEEIYTIIKANFLYLPTWLHPNARGYISAANTGLVGGQDWSFYQALEQEVLYFLEQNRAVLHLAVPHIDFCVFLEQAFFQCMAEQQQISVAYLLPEEINETLHYRLDRFQDVPRRCGYLHLMSYKRNPTACEQMAQRLYIESPALYERCEQVARQLEATHHAVSLPPAAERLVFEGAYRTAALPPTAPIELLEDVRQYEQEKQAWIEALPSTAALRTQWQVRGQSVDAFLSQSDIQIAPQPLQHSQYAKRLSSEWNWAEVNEFMGQNREVDWSANITLPAAYYEVLLYVYWQEGVVKEHLLDAVGMMLLDTFETAQPWTEGIEAVWRQIVQHQPQANEHAIKEVLASRLRFYLYQGVLEVKL
jgi:hypothetical protein